MSLLFASFVSLFFLDAFAEQRTLTQILAALLIHPIPAFAILILTALAWRRPWIGAVGHAALAVAYSAMAWRHPGWVVLICGPLLAIAALYWVSWRRLRNVLANPR